MSALYTKYRDFAKQIGPDPRSPVTFTLADADGPIGNHQPFLAAQMLEIVERREVNIGSIVPGVGQRFGDRHIAADAEMYPVAPVSEVGEGNDALSGHPQHFIEHQVGATQCL